MILTWLGRVALYICFAGALGGVVEQGLALRAKRASNARWWALVSLGGIAAAIGVMEFALITHDFALAYVAENNATFTPVLYSITGLWSALEGSLMLWVFIQCSITCGVLFYYRRDRADAVVGWAAIVLFTVGAFFTFIMMGPADPFIHNAARVFQGAGPNALLQDNPLAAGPRPLLVLRFGG